MLHVEGQQDRARVQLGWHSLDGQGKPYAAMTPHRIQRSYYAPFACAEHDTGCYRLLAPIISAQSSPMDHGAALRGVEESVKK